MVKKQEILEDFWRQFPQYKKMTPTYESIRFEEEEIKEWNRFWINSILVYIFYHIENNVETLKDLKKYIKLN